MSFEWHDPLDKNFYTVLIDNCGKFYARVVRFTKDNKIIYDRLIEVYMPFLTDEMTENFKNRLEKSIYSTMNSSFSNASTIVENRSKYLYFITNDIIPGEISKIKEYKSSSTKLLGKLTISYDFGHDCVYIEYEDKGVSYKVDILELDKTLAMFEILPEKEEKNKSMNIEYNNKNECSYVDIDFGEVFSPEDNEFYIKIRSSYTSCDDGINFNAIELKTGARCRFDDSEKVIRYKNAKVVINAED